MYVQERDEERKFLRECIELYRKHPVLWNVKSEDYSNRRMKVEAYGVLVEKFKQRYPTWGKEEIKKKINSLRTNFRKELKKVFDSEKSGAGLDEIHEPTFWFYNDFMFLIDQEKPSESRSSMQSSGHSDTIPESEEGDKKDDTEGTNVDPIREIQKTPGTKQNIRKTKKSAGNPPAEQDLIELACKRLHEPEDISLALAKTWADKLSHMQPQQQLFAKKGYK